jgi:hypothetical protein
MTTPQSQSQPDCAPALPALPGWLRIQNQIYGKGNETPADKFQRQQLIAFAMLQFVGLDSFSRASPFRTEAQ